MKGKNRFYGLHFALVVCFVFVVFGCHINNNHSLHGIPSNDAFIELKKHISNIEFLNSDELSFIDLSGHYSNPGSQQRKRAGCGLSGHDLYLFPDQTYYYIRWADIIPPVIFNKGKWDIKNGRITLYDDGSIPKNLYRVDFEYFVLKLNIGKMSSKFIMGSEWNYSQFVKQTKETENDPLFTFYLCSLELESSIDSDESVILKTRLTKECWRPEMFRGIKE